jgi:two-component system sensor histidine kinase/response regulator
MHIEEQAEELFSRKEELEKQRDILSELNATKDKLFSILGHDLRSPFSSIIGFSDLLLKNVRKYSIDRIEKHLRIIDDTARSTFNLLNTLLEWAGSQSGGIGFDPELILISKIIDTELILLKQQAERKEVKLLLSTNGNEVALEADPDLLSSVFRNFISNAIKYSFIGNTVEITLRFENDYFSFLVKDYGLGMSAETQEKLFKLNTNESVHGTAGEKGTGLGLVLSKDFIDKHKGKIWAESELDKGSVFGFSIPVRVSNNL